MKISPEKWHYKTLEWAYGHSFFWKWDGESRDYIRKQVSLCPYVDKLIIALALSPFIAIYKAVSYNFQRALINTGIGLSVPLFVTGVEYLVGIRLGWAFFFEDVIFCEALIWGMWGALGLVGKFGWLDENEPKKKPEKKQHEPSLLSSWWEAKHRRVCPLLEFE